MSPVPNPREQLERLKRRVRSSGALVVRSCPTLTPAQKLVLLALLDFDQIEDDELDPMPGDETEAPGPARVDPTRVHVNGALCETCALSEKQTSARLGELAAKGLLTAARRAPRAPGETAWFDITLHWNELARLFHLAAVLPISDNDPLPPPDGTPIRAILSHIEVSRKLDNSDEQGISADQSCLAVCTVVARLPQGKRATYLAA
ncbi:MAG: hypothetical protein ACRDNM_00090 [Gaiellaceae bacterium]